MKRICNILLLTALGSPCVSFADDMPMISRDQFIQYFEDVMGENYGCTSENGPDCVAIADDCKEQLFASLPDMLTAADAELMFEDFVTCAKKNGIQ